MDLSIFISQSNWKRYFTLENSYCLLKSIIGQDVSPDYFWLFIELHKCKYLMFTKEVIQVVVNIIFVDNSKLINNNYIFWENVSCNFFFFSYTKVSFFSHGWDFWASSPFFRYVIDIICRELGPQSMCELHTIPFQKLLLNMTEKFQSKSGQ